MTSQQIKIGSALPTNGNGRTSRPRLGDPLTENLSNKLGHEVRKFTSLRNDVLYDKQSFDSSDAINRLVTEDFETMGAYVAKLAEEAFENVTRCMVYVAPDTFTMAPGSKKLEHRLTVIREKGKVTIDESGRSLNEKMPKPLEIAFADKTPIVCDYQPEPSYGEGIKHGKEGTMIVFKNMDRKSSSMDPFLIEKNGGSGMAAFMPFYYKQMDKPWGVLWLEGDLRAKGAMQEGYSKAFFAAKLAMSAAQQISALLTHRFDYITTLQKRADFEPGMKSAITDVLKRRVSGVYLAFIDFDNFKRINDVYTHPVGDEILRRVGEKMRGLVRADDAVYYRVGGEEFAVILKGVSSEDEAREITERLRTGIESIAVLVRRRSDSRVDILKKDGGRNWSLPPDVEFVKVTCSMGVCDVKEVADELMNVPHPSSLPSDDVHGWHVDNPMMSDSVYRAVYARSAELLHQAKENGKNCVIFDDRKKEDGRYAMIFPR